MLSSSKNLTFCMVSDRKVISNVIFFVEHGSKRNPDA